MLEATTSEGFTRWWPAMKELPQVHSSPGLLASLSAFWLLFENDKPEKINVADVCHTAIVMTKQWSTAMEENGRRLKSCRRLDWPGVSICSRLIENIHHFPANLRLLSPKMKCCLIGDIDMMARFQELVNLYHHSQPQSVKSQFSPPFTVRDDGAFYSW